MRSIRQYGQIGAATIALMFMAGWGFSLMVSTRAASVDSRSAIGMKPALVGSYSVNGTDADGVPYSASQIVDIYLAPSGALELDWNNGGKVGVGQVIDDVLAVASTTKGRTVILLMTINADGSLSGRWTRRTDRGVLGTEVWTRLADYVTGRGSLPAMSSLLFVAVESAIQRVDADDAWWLCDLRLDGRDQRLMVGDDVERHRCRLR